MTKSLSIWHYWWAFLRAHPHIYLGGLAMRILAFVIVGHATGLIQKNFFDALTGSAWFGWTPSSWAVALLLIYLLNNGPSLYNQYLHILWGFINAALLRVNLFKHILTKPGAQMLPASTGEAVSRFRGDADYVAGFTRWTIHIVAMILFAAIAFVVMVRISPWVTALVFIPLTIIILASRLAMARAERYRQEARSATGDVTGFIGEMFGAVQAIKAATSEEQMLAQFRTLNDERQAAALRERFFTAMLFSLFENTRALGTGGILLVVAGAMIDGTFTVGDFSLFVFYLGRVMELVTSIGMASVQLKQTSVSLDRMGSLLYDEPSTTLVQSANTHLWAPLSKMTVVAESPMQPPLLPLQSLTVTDLTYRYPDSENGIQDISFALARGSLTVITGRISSGKSTLLRVMLGLLPRDSGEIIWNGHSINDLKAQFVPPQVAYTPQVPILFSETLRENILLGLEKGATDLTSALQAAVLESDIAQFKDGLETVVGPRGVKLSGGQQQRTAAARMLARSAELMIFDDLSSALDVGTEQILWDRLLDKEGSTYLAVSNRRAVLQRADHVILLKDGQIEDAGRLDALLDRCTEMRLIWNQEDD